MPQRSRKHDKGASGQRRPYHAQRPSAGMAGNGILRFCVFGHEPLCRPRTRRRATEAPPPCRAKRCGPPPFAPTAKTPRTRRRRCFRGGGYWQAATGRSAAELTLTLSAPAQVHYVILREELTVGQRIEAGEILIDGERRARFTVVGHRRICPVNAAAKRQVTIRLLQARAEPTLKAVRIV